jgi:Acyclic terpene utilisation family protein AtuA
MPHPLRIANACAFWGDRIDAAAELISRDPHIDYLTFDYLAEVSMSILARLRHRDPSTGFAPDFLEVIHSLLPAWKSGAKFKIISNAGGLNPTGCASACAKILRDAGLTGKKIGIVTGDDVLPQILQDPNSATYAHLETKESFRAKVKELVTANAYLSATKIVEAIQSGADIIITGRIADPSLAVAPCIAHFGWTATDFNPLAGATVAGHLIECGTQVTGGISTDWLNLPNTNIGFPIVEVSANGSCIVTKPNGTGGAVNEQTVKEQLLYELGDPANYLSPDVTVSFLTLHVEDLGQDRVRISGTTGRPPPQTLKVSATLRAGFRASGMLTIIGKNAVPKAQRAAEVIREKLKSAGMQPRQYHVECLGSGDGLNGVIPIRRDLMETVLRITVADNRKEIVERFSREMIPLVTSGPQGTTGYFDGRPPVREVFAYWPCLIDRALVHPKVEIVTA